MSTLGLGGAEEDTDVVMWKERYRCKLENIEIAKFQGKICDVKMGVANDTQIRTVHFQTTREAQTFVEIIKEMKKMQEERAKRLSERYTLENSAQPPSPALASHSPRSDSNAQLAPLNPATLLTENIRLLAQRTIFKDQSIKNDPNSINLLVEIVSASNLPISDIFSSDPFVVVMEGNKELHRTKIIPP